MKTINAIKKIIKNNRKELEEKYNLREIGIFGSYARGDQESSATASQRSR